MKISILGNCQAENLRRIIAAMLPGFDVVRYMGPDSIRNLDNSDFIFVQTTYYDYQEILQKLVIKSNTKVNPWPTFFYSAFHPDLIVEASFASPFGYYHSSITVASYLAGLSISDTISLFRHDVFAKLGYFDFEKSSDQAILADLDVCGLDSKFLLDQWYKSGCFAHTVNHPTTFVTRTIAAALLSKIGLKPYVLRPELFVRDDLSVGLWPIHREIADHFGIQEIETVSIPAESTMDFPTFVARSFACYDALPNGSVTSSRVKTNPGLTKTLASLKRTIRRHPYMRLPSTSYWQQSVTESRIEELDPVLSPKFTISSADQVATAGSCFAQHIAKLLVAENQGFLVTEPCPPNFSAAEAAAKNYGVFSARFGNIYTSRQLLQLVLRAYGKFTPEDDVWKRPDGRFVDPFRPQIEPEGFPSAAAVREAAHSHMACVREMFEKADVFIFTLGLTECWISKVDGAVYPIAPGVQAGVMDERHYAFKNLKFEEVVKELKETVSFLRKRNSRLRFLFTVSPVPLVATYEKRHVLVSTTVSKSVLHAAVNDVCKNDDYIEYFPSYEIICGSPSKGIYFEADKRSVDAAGVEHVMNVLRKNYLKDDPNSRPEISQRNLYGILASWFRRKKAVNTRLVKLFDAEWYLEHYSDVRDAGIDPLIHYLNYGIREGRWPNPVFDPKFYIWQNKGSEASRANPLRHYIEFGFKKGLRPTHLFDPDVFVEKQKWSETRSPLEGYIEMADSPRGQSGVKRHVMGGTSHLARPSLLAEIKDQSRVLCDEELLVRET